MFTFRRVGADSDELCTATRGLVAELGSMRNVMLMQARMIRPMLDAMRGVLGPDARELVGTSMSSSFIAECLNHNDSEPRGDVTPDEALLESRDAALFNVRWAQDGCPIYQLTDSLAASLILTDPDSLPTSTVCWPYEVFVVELPPGFFSVQSDSGRVQDARWLMVHRYLGAWSEGAPGGHYCCAETSRIARNAETALLRGEFRLALQHLRDFEARVMLEFPTQRCMTTLRLIGCEGTTLYRRDPYPESDEAISRWYGTKPAGEGLTSTERRTLTVAMRLVANLCIYLQTRVGPLPARTLKARDGAKPKRKGSPPPREETVATLFEIGREIHLPRIFRDAAHARANQATNPAAWRLMRRQVVCGHTKYQACGKRWGERRLVTVAPYERYKNVVAQATKFYKVSTPDERVRA